MCCLGNSLYWRFKWLHLKKIFFKERNTKLLLCEGTKNKKNQTKPNQNKKRKQNKGDQGSKMLSQKGRVCPKKQIHRSVRGQTRFSKVYWNLFWNSHVSKPLNDLKMTGIFIFTITKHQIPPLGKKISFFFFFLLKTTILEKVEFNSLHTSMCTIHRLNGLLVRDVHTTRAVRLAQAATLSPVFLSLLLPKLF